jgi:RHS repeat-associated protein
VRPEDHTATNTYRRDYGYDKLGNIITLRHTANNNPGNNFTRTYNYDSSFNDNKLQSFDVNGNNYSYSYDANGNQIQENTDRFFEWNYADKLAFYKRQAGSSNPSLWAHYLYDASGQRIKKIVNKPGKIQEITVYIDGIFEHSYTKVNDQVNSNRNYNTLHILDDTSRIATLRVGNDDTDSTPALKYYVEDHLGNASVTVKDVGGRINLEEYYPFGETSFGSFEKKRYRYNGKEKDEESGLYEYGQRYYAPWLCRFFGVDPVATDFPYYTPYNYAGNKPVSKVDLEGLQESDAETGGGNETNNSRSGVLEVNKKSGLPTVNLEEITISATDSENKGKKTSVEKNDIDNLKLNKTYTARRDNTQTSIDIRTDMYSQTSDAVKARGPFKKAMRWLIENEPALEGNGDKSGTVKSGEKHVSDDAEFSNNSGIEASPERNIDVEIISALLSKPPGPFKSGDGKMENMNEVLDRLTGIAEETLPKYNGSTDENSESLTDSSSTSLGELLESRKDSIRVIVKEETFSTSYVMGYNQEHHGKRITKKLALPKDTVGGVFKGDSTKKVIGTTFFPLR